MSAAKDSVAAWSWPDSLDALQAAPNHHGLVFENAHVRVLDMRIAPGETVPLHTHRWPAVLEVQAWADFVRRDEQGRVLVDTRGQPPPAKLPLTIWSPALPPHTLENVGSGEIRVLSVEIKSAGAS